ncbi:uncharacterized protein LOC116339162 [Contarinia nasturtii]|uniref:uncharacterized protein LOC116339162 n=1 Tax=Contarinia nasturtii TaxID=265458 RepID=UPI0012D383D1|nr:uncharacterized protein LOC116339162 [Contarinia nasturtii]
MQGQEPGTSNDRSYRLNSKQKLSREASPISLDLQRPLIIPSSEMWIDVGVQKSFSTSDIAYKTETIKHKNRTGNYSLSEFALNSIQNQSARLSRSYSTWVSVGDHSQLPSPHGQQMLSSQQQLSALTQPFTATDLIKSMNKKFFFPTK